jgi:hypothetical protein
LELQSPRGWKLERKKERKRKEKKNKTAHIAVSETHSALARGQGLSGSVILKIVYIFNDIVACNSFINIL